MSFLNLKLHQSVGWQLFLSPDFHTFCPATDTHSHTHTHARARTQRLTDVTFVLSATFAKVDVFLWEASVKTEITVIWSQRKASKLRLPRLFKEQHRAKTLG